MSTLNVHNTIKTNRIQQSFWNANHIKVQVFHTAQVIKCITKISSTCTLSCRTKLNEHKYIHNSAPSKSKWVLQYKDLKEQILQNTPPNM